MNFELSKIPNRTTQPRNFGITMISDRVLNLAETENMLSVASQHIDMVKLAFGTAMVTPILSEKIKIFKSYNIPVFFGGLLFEAFIIRNQFEDYIRVCEQFGITHMEVSDGSINIPHADKCNYISLLTKYGTVLSEIGRKDANNIMPPYK